MFSPENQKNDKYMRWCMYWYGEPFHNAYIYISNNHDTCFKYLTLLIYQSDINKVEKVD